MKQTKLILFLPIIGIVEVLLTWQDVHLFQSFIYLEMVVACFCGYLGTKRDMWLLLAIYYSWIAVSDAIFMVPQWLSGAESLLFAMLVYWIYRRPEWIPSDPVSDTVQIAFYYGDKSPFVAKIMSLIGMNVTGIAVIIGDWAIVPIEKSGMLEKRPSESLKKWIKLDTGHKPGLKLDTVRGIELIRWAKLEGRKVEYAGCMKAFKDVLIQVVPDWSPNDTPSSLMGKMLANRK